MKPSLRKVLLPTAGQALVSLLASIVLIGFLYREQILQRIKNGTSAQLINQIGYGNALSRVTNGPIIHTAVIVAFWSGVGLVAYTIVWSFINVMIEARNEVVLETEYTNKAALTQRMRTPLAQLALAAGLFGGLIACAKWVFPFWLDLAATAISTAQIWKASVMLLAPIFGIALTIYLLILLGQLVFWLG
jgi:hypothetical protein